MVLVLQRLRKLFYETKRLCWDADLSYIHFFTSLLYLYVLPYTCTNPMQAYSTELVWSPWQLSCLEYHPNHHQYHCMPFIAPSSQLINLANNNDRYNDK